MGEPIEHKQFNMNLKGVAWLISSTVVLVGAIYGNYTLLKTEISNVDDKIDKVQLQKTSDDRLFELRIKILEANVEAVKVQIDNLRNQVTTNKQTLEQQIRK